MACEDPRIWWLPIVHRGEDQLFIITFSSREAARRIESIESRIKNGAQIVAKNYYFDHKRHLVRTKKNPAAAGE